MRQAGPLRRDIRTAITSLAEQDLGEPAEFIFVESELLRADLPPELPTILPGLRILFFPETDSYPLKNHGVEAATAEFVAILDADCIPEPSWLRSLLQALREYPSAAAVSGKTVYAEQAFSARTCALLARSYIDPGDERGSQRSTKGYTLDSWETSDGGQTSPRRSIIGCQCWPLRSEHGGFRCLDDPGIVLLDSRDEWISFLRSSAGRELRSQRLPASMASAFSMESYVKPMQGFARDVMELAV